MIQDNSDLSWERWGRTDPYYGVLADEKFRGKHLDADLKGEFLETGRAHVQRVLTIIASRSGNALKYDSALDFGCGVGRLVIPLAQKFKHVTAVDVSASMLKAAERNCQERGVANVTFVRSDDQLSDIPGKFDLVHSYLVFQHIPVPRGEKLVAQLIERLNEGGVLAVQLPFLRHDSLGKRCAHFLRKNFRPLAVLGNIVRGKPWNDPFMQMNTYNLNRVAALLSDHGTKDVFCEVIDTGGFVSAFLITSKHVKSVKVEEKHLWAAEL